MDRDIDQWKKVMQQWSTYLLSKADNKMALRKKQSLPSTHQIGKSHIPLN